MTELVDKPGLLFCHVNEPLACNSKLCGRELISHRSSGHLTKQEIRAGGVSEPLDSWVV